MKRPAADLYYQATPPACPDPAGQILISLSTATAESYPNIGGAAFQHRKSVAATMDFVRHEHFMQRGSDELLSQSGAVSNGAVMSPQPNHADNNNDAKKVRMDSGPDDDLSYNSDESEKVKLEPKNNHNTKPSKVIHIRNIPNEVTEAEIIHLGIPFGRVTNVLVLKGKNQAFLEMADEVAATSMVSYFTSCVAQLRGRAVYVQFSTHKELKTDQTHSNANASAQAALQAAQALAAGQNDTQGGPNTVLRVIVEHMVYPVTLDVLYQIFSRYGKVLKIVTFTKNNTFQALIQYPDVVTAQAAKLSLDGQNIYNACCTLRIEYSKLNSLNVKYNNDKSRDYTNPNLPTGDPSLDSALALTGATGVLASPFAAMHGLGNPLTSPYASSVGVCNPHHRETHPALLYNGGSSSWLQPQQHDRDHSSPQKSAGIFPYLVAAAMPLAGFSLPGGGGANALGGSATGLRLPVQAATGSVLLVSNLNEEMVTPDALFTLFGVYGDVLRVKILFNKKDSALVQMAEAHHAHLAMTHMDKLHVFGKQIRVMPSKHQSVQLPKEGQPDAGLTKDYTNSPLHRFKKPGSKNYQNIYPPSATLHLSNIPPQLTEEAIKEAFTNAGFTVKAFKFFPKDRKMALIQMQSIEDAVMALIKMHNYQLSESNHLRVSFSKSTI